MAGRGPAPKPTQLRQRRNKKAAAATLQAPESPKVPALLNPDKREWHRLTRAWWKHVWESPMASEYLPTDVDGLSRVAVLVDDFNQATDARVRKELLTEIRLQEARFGLSPADRNRLAWEMAKGEEAKRKRGPAPRPTATGDPRDVLKVLEGGA